MVAKSCLTACVVVLALLLAAVTALFLWYIIDKGPAAVETENGTIKGRVVRGPGGNYVEEYLGIPYAYPPVRERRWARPEPHGYYRDGSYGAYDMKNACWGFRLPDEEFEGRTMWVPTNPMSEDCLYLNVWVPRPKRKDRAVMVWIHGGGLVMGSSSLDVYNGRALAEHGDVIVVSINYRLGIFGFLSTGDGRIEGNYGMLDQQEAFRWVKTNIKHFGGDPDLVTIFGESAGSSSVGFHALSTTSKNLFKRIIHQSGSPNTYLSMMSKEDAKERSAEYFRLVGCNDNADVLNCLRTISGKHAWEQSLDYEPKFAHTLWRPIVDGEFLTKTSYDLLEDGNYPRYDTLIGVNQNEGTYFLPELEGFSEDTTSEVTQPQFEKALEDAFWELSPGIRNQAKNEYEKSLPRPRSGADLRDLTGEMVGDRIFVCPAVNLTRDYAEHGSKVFFYYLTYRASNEVWPEWMGVVHTADIEWVFGDPLRPASREKAYTKNEKQFSKDIMSYWSNFAKYGDPNGDDLPYWPPYALDDPTYMELGNSTTPQVRRRQLPQSEYCKMWAEENGRYFRTMN